MDAPGCGAAAAARKPSLAGSLSSVATARQRVVPELEFSVGAAKAKVLKALEEAPAAFLTFMSGAPLFDRLANGLILYLCATLQREALSRCVERSRAGHAEGVSPQLVATRLRELQDEAAGQRAAVGQAYAEVILKHSSYKKPQQDRRFFESLLQALTALLGEAFERLGKQKAIEQELGWLFRSKHFNTAARVHGPPRSVDTLTCMQLWETKNATSNRALHAQLISSLFEKPPTLPTQIAALSNTPLVAEAVKSPLVARARLADPAERDALLALPFGGRHNNTNKQQQCVCPVARLPQLAAVAEEAYGAAGPSPRIAAPPGGGLRASTIAKQQATAAALPEAAGLPQDEDVAYLCLVRRTVLYGPSLGLAAGPASLPGGGAPGLSACSSVVSRT